MYFTVIPELLSLSKTIFGARELMMEVNILSPIGDSPIDIRSMIIART